MGAGLSSATNPAFCRLSPSGLQYTQSIHTIQHLHATLPRARRKVLSIADIKGMAHRNFIDAPLGCFEVAQCRVDPDVLQRIWDRAETSRIDGDASKARGAPRPQLNRGNAS